MSFTTSVYWYKISRSYSQIASPFKLYRDQYDCSLLLLLTIERRLSLITNILCFSPSRFRQVVSGGKAWSSLQTIAEDPDCDWTSSSSCRSRANARGKDSEYENLESDGPEDEERVPLSLNVSRDSEQREIDEFEEEERRLLAEEEKVRGDMPFFVTIINCNTKTFAVI